MNRSPRFRVYNNILYLRLLKLAFAMIINQAYYYNLQFHYAKGIMLIYIKSPCAYKLSISISSTNIWPISFQLSLTLLVHYRSLKHI